MNLRRLAIPALVLALGGCKNMQMDKGTAQEMSPPPLPPGWTQQDMQACMEAGTPGEMHKFLASGVGHWRGQDTMWMGPDSEPMKSQSDAKVTSIMDGRFTKIETTSTMPGMGKFQGFGIYGYDNVSQKFVSTWIDNMGTGMMQGTGELSPDHKTLTWTFTFNCPINKKPTTMRQVETVISPTSRTLEAWTTDPKSGKEYKMLHIDMTRK
jgi:hypothetical protein